MKWTKRKRTLGIGEVRESSCRGDKVLRRGVYFTVDRFRERVGEGRVLSEIIRRRREKTTGKQFANDVSRRDLSFEATQLLKTLDQGRLVLRKF